ncbi:potassium channel subfamily K member 12-like [Lethenteron reissneri]|uniref:potassium channel subfamily K member 12-like n=1 Tax=Lethenteron reissneri TaxID=7753 RepID=UPI002AB77653|nr:potassium channel subfamily K member 12-like [Lethenteron reissneri]
MPAHGGGGGGGGGDCAAAAAAGGGGSPVCEDNARFALLALLIVCYMLFGAAVFSALERPAEEEARRRWCSRLSNFTRTHGVSAVAMEELLRDYEAASLQAAVGADELKPRWDFSGAFYFVGTVVSTIGFGMTTPATVPGKVFLIFYGMLGCSAAILFFNLFLERLITLLACVMRSCRQRRFWRKGRQVAAAWVSEAGPSAPAAAAAATATAAGPGRTRHDGVAREAWKPSVYHVMLILGAAAITIACSASALYSAVEDWSYVDSLYFCFVAFSTIGFGDLVSGQAAATKVVDQSAYRFVNFAFILLGVCCIYSLFNVISIVIKQLLNWTLKKVEQARRYLWQRGFRPRGRNAVVPSNVHRHQELNHHQQHQQQQQHGRQQPRTQQQQQQQQQHSQQHQRHWQRRQQQQQQHQKMRTISIETDLGVDSETDGGRRVSGEMISMQDFLASNKVSLAIMQKQLSEAANGTAPATASSAPAAAAVVKVDNGFSYGVGSLAIMNNRLAETSIVN